MKNEDNTFNRKFITITAFLATIWLFLAMPAQAQEYMVKKGDTLSHIGQQFNVPYQEIMQTSGLETTVIYVGQKIVIPDPESLDFGAKVKQNLMFDPSPKEAQPTLNETTSDNAIKVLGNEELKILAKIIYAEARGESLEGKVAVGAVVLNRLKSPRFPKTLGEIVYQKTEGGVYQFSPVQDGSINLEPDEEAYEAARQSLSGVDPTGGALYFYNPEIAHDQWITGLPVVKVIGNHVFATETAQ